MNYSIFKLRFKGAVHIGEKNLTDSERSIPADTVFSALCHAALSDGGAEAAEKLAALVKGGELLFSDALPFLDDDYYLPKPIIAQKRREKIGVRPGDDAYTDKKALKKLKYVSAGLLPDYLAGKFDAAFEMSVIQEQFGSRDLRVRVSLTGEKPEPYHVGVFRFSENAGLYVIVGYRDDAGIELVDRLFDMLSLSGIGGKRTSGLGRFSVKRCGSVDLLPLLKADNAKKLMTLSVAMPKEDELDNSLAGATYLLKKRSGFVLSPDYADTQVKKRDFYSFAAGSCFERPFAGDVFDVSCGGSHPVYRYAKPMFVGVA